VTEIIVVTTPKPPNRIRDLLGSIYSEVSSRWNPELLGTPESRMRSVQELAAELLGGQPDDYCWEIPT